MSKHAVLITIDTNAVTTNDAFGRSFIRCLCDEDSRLVPEFLSTTENYKDPFRGIDDFLSNWWAVRAEVRVDGRLSREEIQGPSWKRKSPLASRGSVFHGFTNQKNSIIPSRIWFQSRWAKDVDFDHLFETWVDLSHPIVGMLHLFTGIEQREAKSEEESWFQTGSFGGPARPGIPNIGWAMAYGVDHATKVDTRRIRAAGFPVDEQDGSIVVRVTERLSDVIDNFDHFSERRAELKSLFQPDFFWIKEEPCEHERQC